MKSIKQKLGSITAHMNAHLSYSNSDNAYNDSSDLIFQHLSDDLLSIGLWMELNVSFQLISPLSGIDRSESSNNVESVESGYMIEIS